jgi:hypothetical protein
MIVVWSQTDRRDDFSVWAAFRGAGTGIDRPARGVAIVPRPPLHAGDAIRWQRVLT